MNNKLKQFIRDAKEVKLRDHDRAKMRAHFSELVGVSAEVNLTKHSWNLFRLHPTAAIGFGATAFAILLTTGVAAAAEGSVPGDVLYPVKIHVTEKMRSAITRTHGAKAAWETQRIERRLTEVEKIIHKKRNTTALSSLEIDISAHAERIQKSIDKLERSGNIQAAAEASSNIEAPLNAHKKIIQELKKTQKGADTIIETIENKERAARKRRQTLESRVDDSDSKKEETAKRKTDTTPTDDSSFSAKQRTRREKREIEVIKKAEKTLDVSVSNDDLVTPDNNEHEDDSDARRRNPAR